MNLQQRDREILRVCYEQQFITCDQVLRFFYKDVARSAGFRRLKMFEQDGYIKRRDYPKLDSKRLIRLTDRGLAQITEDIQIEVPQVRTPDIRYLRHDAIVTSARLRLHELWNGKWVPEKAIKQENFPRVPDGLFIFPSGNKVAVEIESSPKPRSRFLGLLEDWRRIDVKLVLFIATQEHVFDLIKRLIPEGPVNVPFALVMWSELERGTPDVWTTDGPVNIFTRKEY